MKMRLPIGLFATATGAAATAALAIGVAPSLEAGLVPHGAHHKLVNTISFTSPTASTTEGDTGTKNLNFALTISPAAPPGGLTLNYTVADGTANAGSDYSDPHAGSLTIPQNSTSFVLPITINGDVFKEADETFTVSLTSATGGYGASGSATGTITNDDYQCGTPAVTPCWSTFQLDGGNPPALLQLQTFMTNGNVQVQLKYNNNLELSSGGLTNSSLVHMVINVGAYDPVVFGTTGQIQSLSETTGGSANTLTLDVNPKASSWRGAAPGCTTQSCGSDINPVTADHDYTDLMLGFISDLSSVNMSQSLKDAMHGTWLGTNAQAFSFPTFNANNGTVNFTVAAPHFKTDGSTQNTGFFQFFLPDALVQQMGVADPSAVTNGTFNVTNSNGGTVIFDVSHQSSPAGVLILAGTNPPTLPMFNYSSPTFTVAKANTAPGAPIGVSATAGDGQAAVSFSAPASDGGAAISSYTVTASPGGATASGSGSPITVTGLTNGTSYTFAVTATNSVGTGAASAASGAVTPAGVPGAPTGVSATAGDAQATVSFTAPAAHGAAISSYTVTASPGGATATGSGSPITVTGLTNGTSYTFTVTAANSVGTGAASAPSGAVSPSASAPSGPSASVSSEQATVTVMEQTGSTTSASIVAGESSSLTLTAAPGEPPATAPSVAWSSGTFASDIDVTAVTTATTSTTTPPALSGFSVGSLAVELNFTSGGTAVHTFAAPLEIVFPGAPADLAPGYSSDDGVTWTAIPLLAGTTLPDGQKDGYYRDAAGAVHILTRHASYFGLLGSLVLHYGTAATTLPVGSSSIVVSLAPERQATAIVKLQTREGKTLRTLDVTLPAGTAKLKIPLPAGLKAGLYLVKVTAASGPASTRATLLVRLTRGLHK